MSGLARLDVERSADRWILRVTGEIDISNARDVAATVEDLMPNGTETLVIDLSGTTYLDSAGVHLLFVLTQRLQTRRQELMLVVPQDAPVRAVLELTGLTRIIPVATDLDGVAG
jgi:anti-anti-sigma factor